MEQAQRTHDYCMYPNIRWDFLFLLFIISNKEAGVPITLQSNTKVNCIQHKHCLQTEDCEVDHHLCRVMLYSGKYGNVKVKFTL